MKSSIPSLSNYLDENLAQDEFNDEVSNGIVAPTLPQQNQVALHQAVKVICR
jgi:membrane-bound lytic murein transglycosylase MltF